MKFLAVVPPNKKQQHADRAQTLFKTFISKAVINKPVENSMISGHGDVSCRPTELNTVNEI
jgi:hypothetical protein